MTSTAAGERLVLPPDVSILDVGELGASVRERFDWAPGDRAVTRSGARFGARLVDEDAARLLEYFREPATIVDAVLAYSTSEQVDAQATLEAAYGMLRNLRAAQLLVVAGSAAEQPLRPIHEPGSELAGARIERCVHLTDDVEVYRVALGTGKAALKIARPGCPPRLAHEMERDAHTLELLDGSVAPSLLAHGAIDERPYLLAEWCPGTTSRQYADERRISGLAQAAEAVHVMVVSVAEAYAALHARGVLHGDVQPRNILVGDDGTVKLIDFAYGALIDGGDGYAPPARAGVAYYWEPEYARARLARRRLPAASAAGEQYSLAAVIYLLLCGENHIRFSLESRRVLEQTIAGPVVPFIARGREAWPELEAILRRALAPAPEERFASVAEFAQALADVTAEPHPVGVRRRRARARNDSLLAQTLERLPYERATTGLEGPRCTVNFGAAGVAYLYYRLSCLREDPQALFLADAWSARAVRDLTRPDACTNVSGTLSERRVGPISLYHSPTGVHAVRALVCDALNEREMVVASIDRLLANLDREWDGPDATTGWMSIVLGAAILGETIDLDPATREKLTRTVAPIVARVWDQLARSSLDERQPLAYWGMAHGWAGCLYATMRWSAYSGDALPHGAAEALAELAGRVTPRGAGATLGRPGGQVADWPGWCHGSAGYAHLWLAAHEREPGGGYLELARRACTHSADHAHASNWTVCCGLAGQAYALLAYARATGEDEWVRKARQLARMAVEGARAGDCETPNSLYKGHVGVALLEADIEQPAFACQPMFERHT